MKKWYSIATILVIIMVLGMSGIAFAQKPIIIKVGMPTALSGPAAPWGQIGMDPYLAWIELFNKEGFKVGGKTYNFKLITIDDKNSPEGGTAAAKQLIFGDGCKFLAGHWTWNYAAISAVSNPAKIILVTRNGSGIVYDAKKQPYNVFGLPSDEAWIYDILAAHEKFPGKKFALMESTLGLNQTRMKEMNTQFFDPAGLKYHWEIFPYGTTNFAPYLTKVAEAGCEVIYNAADIGSTMMMAKQRWEMGYKWPVGQGGVIIDPAMYIAVCGRDAAQGLMGSYFGIWDYKKTKVDPKLIALCQETQKVVSQKQGKPFTYTGWIGWLPNHLLILAQAMQKAGTVDNADAIMKVIRGGTFSTTTGTYTLSGAKTYGSPVFFGEPGCVSRIEGDKEVYFSEHPLRSIP
jgi:branched-chain amino acid transport system substrate-binding protein